jgi:hypothetical protein
MLSASIKVAECLEFRVFRTRQSSYWGKYGQMAKLEFFTGSELGAVYYRCVKNFDLCASYKLYGSQCLFYYKSILPNLCSRSTAYLPPVRGDVVPTADWSTTLRATCVLHGHSTLPNSKWMAVLAVILMTRAPELLSHCSHNCPPLIILHLHLES